MDYRLVVKPRSANLKRSTDMFTKMDPYVKVRIGGEEQTSSTHCDGGKKPTWNDSMTFRVDPNRDHIAHVRIMDKDTFTKDDLVGETNVPLRDVFNMKRVNKSYDVTYKGRGIGQINIELEVIQNGGNMGGGMGQVNHISNTGRMMPVPGSRVNQPMGGPQNIAGFGRPPAQSHAQAPPGFANASPSPQAPPGFGNAAPGMPAMAMTGGFGMGFQNTAMSNPAQMQSGFGAPQSSQMGMGGMYQPSPVMGQPGGNMGGALPPGFLNPTMGAQGVHGVGAGLGGMLNQPSAFPTPGLSNLLIT